ncbi:MAG: hypothetical protein WC496_00715 [Phycisphaerae bacterium]|jgi:ribonucleotide reductase beta subunit family protein with ferritin-like domain
MQLRVIKADGTEEEYLHTKVIAAFINAFAEPAGKYTYAAQQLAEAVTFYLYNSRSGSKISSSEILSVIKAALSSTGFNAAAEALAEHYQKRNLLRSRVEVVKADMEKISDIESLQKIGFPNSAARWNKSKIIIDLISEYNLDPATARTIASLVEEKILNSGFRLVTTGFVRFLTLWQTKEMLTAQQQIKTCKTSAKTDSTDVYHADTDDRIRQLQNGLCPVEA